MKQVKKTHLLLIRKLSWSFHSTTGIEVKELFAQASLHYLQACKAYSKRKGVKKTTFLYKFIQNELINFLKREKKHTNITIDDTMDIPYFQTPFFELFDALSTNSQKIVEMILDDPTSYAKLPAKMARGLVIKNLRRQTNWTNLKCWESLSNIKLELMKL